MCIAAIISKSVTLSDLQNMEKTNPDGAGVAWLDPDARAIRFVRGLTASEIFNMQEAGQMTYPYLLHFRWATVGIEDHTNVHPFPTGEQTLHGERTGAAQSVFMHNGTWGNYNRYIQRAARDGIELPSTTQLAGMSDTAVAAWLCGQYPEILEEMSWATAIAFVGEDDVGDPVLDIQQRGHTWVEHQGNQYSNLHWHPWEARYGTSFAKTDLADRKFWTEYSKSKGWSWATDDEVTIPEKHVREAWTDAEWEEYLAERYGRETASEAIRMERLAALEDDTPLEDMTDDQMREFLGPDYPAFDIDSVSEDPEVVNAFLARQMVA